MKIVNDRTTSNVNQSFLDAGLDKDTGIKTVPGGNIKIDATGKVSLNYGAIYNTLDSGACHFCNEYKY